MHESANIKTSHECVRLEHFLTSRAISRQQFPGFLKQSCVLILIPIEGKSFTRFETFYAAKARVSLTVITITPKLSINKHCNNVSFFPKVLLISVVSLSCIDQSILVWRRQSIREFFLAPTTLGKNPDPGPEPFTIASSRARIFSCFSVRRTHDAYRHFTTHPRGRL